MNEIGEYLKQERRKNGIGINEASEDLKINSQLLEAIEEGNSKAFKDIFELKNYVKIYSKYLGLNVDKILDEFNDFIFEKTSKISLEDIKNARKSEEKTNRVASPYTIIKHTRYDFAPIVLLVAILLLISLVVYVALRISRNDQDNIIHELMKEGVLYEFTK